MIAGKYDDRNHNHKRNGNDPWLPGWTMQLYSSSNTPAGEHTTDKTGRTIFMNHTPGAYTVCEMPQSGWFNITPNGLDPTYRKPCYIITVAPGKAIWVRFGNSTTPLSNGAALITDVIVTNLVGGDDVNDPWPDERQSAAHSLFLPLVRR